MVAEWLDELLDQTQEYFDSDDDRPMFDPGAKRRKMQDQQDDDDLFISQPTTVLTPEPLEDDVKMSTQNNSKLAEFERQLSMVFGPVSPDTVEELHNTTNGDVEQAMNIMLDRNSTTDQSPPTTHSHTESANEALSQNIKTAPSSPPLAVPSHPPSIMVSLPYNWESVEIGGFTVSASLIRSGTGILKFQEKLSVTRQVLKAKRFSDEDGYAIKFVNSDRIEVARITGPTAKWMSALIASEIASFSAICCSYESAWRVGDVAFIYVECFLLRSGFDNPLLNPTNHGDSSRTTFLPSGDSRETADEKLISYRQKGLISLFSEVNLQVKKASDDINFSRLPSETETNEHADADTNNETLTSGQLDMFYHRANSNSSKDNAPETETPQGMKLDLRPYQKKGLTWLINREKVKGDDADIMDPLWAECYWPEATRVETSRSIFTESKQGFDRFYWNRSSGQLSLKFPSIQHSGRGGILADEMGLGKTISTIALICDGKSMVDTATGDSTNNGVLSEAITKPIDNSGSMTPSVSEVTLVVAPLSLLSQWESEVKSASNLKPLIYYGSLADSLQNILKSPEAPDVVITSYGTVMSEHDGMVRHMSNQSDTSQNRGWIPPYRPSGLYGVNFRRIVLDEAHSIKNRNTKTAKACFDLTAERRWLLTGTPIVNRLEDLFSLLKFLKVAPWDNFHFWKTFISTPFENKKVTEAMNTVQSIMEPLILRRTKDMKQANGQLLVDLPPKTIVIKELEFSYDEKVLYDHIFARAKSDFEGKLSDGTLMKSYVTILAVIMRLRQICCHPRLVMQKSGGKKKAIEQTSNISPQGELEAEANLGDDSLHLFDDMELQQLMHKNFGRDEGDSQIASTAEINAFGSEVARLIEQNDAECPICSTCPIELDNQALTECLHLSCLTCLMEHIQFQKNKGVVPRCHTCRQPVSSSNVYKVDHTGEKVMLRRYNTSFRSTKVSALVEELKAAVATGEKSVVFSQFTSFLDIIEEELSIEHIKYLRFDGTLNQRERTDVINEFTNSTQPVALLISLKSGGVGLNLVCATKAFMMDPWWSYAVEAQAIDRIHRMGQLQHVKVTRFIVKGTMEQRMLKIQERKKFLASSLNLTEDEKKQQRLEDIKSLFEDNVDVTGIGSQRTTSKGASKSSSRESSLDAFVSG